MTVKSKTRFAPSPTGIIHMGNARTALFNWLMAMQQGGIFLLRIEDTDRQRSEQTYADQLMEDLRWLGMEWQEGPGIGGDHAPYYQSERLSVYDNYYQDLVDRNLAYPCFCSEESLAVTRKLQRAAGEPPRYPGTCAHLTTAEVAAKEAEGLKPALRFRVPKDATVSFEDLVRGKQSFNTNDLGDFIIRKQDGSASFMFCNAIDDSLMGVSQVLRGEDHLTNTPRQLLILQALALPEPSYGHISIILGQDGSPLSKRNGSRSIQELGQIGYLPMAVGNYMARLGCSFDTNDLLPLKELARSFDQQRLVKGASRFDEEQLKFWQKEAVMAASDEEILQWLAAHIDSLVPEEDLSKFVATVRDNLLMPEDAIELATAFYAQTLTLSDNALAVLKQAGKEFFSVCADNCATAETDWKSFVSLVKEATGVKGKKLFQPLRVALTGQLHGPEMPQITVLLGNKRIQTRFQQALTLID